MLQHREVLLEGCLACHAAAALRSLGDPAHEHGCLQCHDLAQRREELAHHWPMLWLGIRPLLHVSVKPQDHDDIAVSAITAALEAQGSLPRGAGRGARGRTAAARALAQHVRTPSESWRTACGDALAKAAPVTDGPQALPMRTQPQWTATQQEAPQQCGPRLRAQGPAPPTSDTRTTAWASGADQQGSPQWKQGCCDQGRGRGSEALAVAPAQGASKRPFRGARRDREGWHRQVVGVATRAPGRVREAFPVWFEPRSGSDRGTERSMELP